MSDTADDLDEVDDEEVEEEVEEEEDGDEEEEAPPAGGGKKKLILIIAGVVLLLFVGGAGLFLAGVLDPLLGIEEGVEPPPDPNQALSPAIYHELPELMVDLKTGRCRAPYLKLKVQVAVSTPQDIAVLEEAQPYIIDKLKMHLRSLERQDLVGIEGAEKLRFDIITILNRTARPVKIRNVLFKDFLLQ